MPLSRDAIAEFKTIYEEEYGERLSDEDAQEMSERLLRLFALLARPLPADTSSPKTIPSSSP